MILNDYQTPACYIKSGSEAAIAVGAGQAFRVETSPDGEEVLNVTCPDGKVWSIRVIVEITETDV